jgi:lipid-A-disaccharide synthase-like uncharacterized protein
MRWALVLAVSAADRTQWPPATALGWFWFVFGLGAQAAFAGRFVVQWVASERRGRSYIPLPFWYLSLVGGVMLLIYAVWVRNPVFALGQAAGCFVYVRNLMLLRREKGLAALKTGDSQVDGAAQATPPGTESKAL